MSFSSLSLSQPLLDAVREAGYQQPTPVQQKVIPLAINGEDIIASAETGTGKTAAFALSLLHQLQQADIGDSPRQLKVLVMTPTRELAIQIQQCFEQYGQFLPYVSLAIYGGASINPQRKTLARGVDVLIATPGRLFDIMGQYQLDLADVCHLVIDEADRMLDLGFVKDIEKVKRLVAFEHQTMMFSATYSQAVETLAKTMLRNPQVINVKQQATAGRITQQAYLLDKRRKAELLAECIGKYNWQQVMVFVSTKESADFLLSELSLDGINAAVFHGDKTQGARNRALEEFKTAKLRVLIATDLAARGLDIAALPRVINFELPEDNEDYVHRIGRTGRAGLSGEAISFFSEQEHAKLAEIEALIEQKIEVVIPKGYEPGAPMPARYRELSASKPKKTFKSHKTAKHNAAKKPRFGQDKQAKKPARQGKYAAKKG
ncbi:DEAD/DEAH box helicase [Shewanella intestini]|uniref:DEAD/DEAH box helicase n=1 Tax=Shewanella intestini TaxID=2017544 RepID=A0ABS5HZV0_9GAMM|nr:MULTISPECIES: DEAD/DEAH box helicase [Shewanella]MBR9727305.1 DEAD/DEAH box helicase [Shewanella intestini]MRG35645.1 DEAD/DEAH box helicase [Shewanella sp. XMDDZSB0408]